MPRLVFPDQTVTLALAHRRRRDEVFSPDDSVGPRLFADSYDDRKVLAHRIGAEVNRSHAESQGQRLDQSGQRRRVVCEIRRLAGDQVALCV